MPVFTALRAGALILAVNIVNGMVVEQISRLADVIENATRLR